MTRKIITFSYDDAVKQDRRLIEILNRYGLKATFNLNSGLLGTQNTLVREGKSIAHDKIELSELKELYRGHEVAAHTLTHPHLTKLDDGEVIRQVECDRLALSEIVGYEVLGMAYPGGGFQNSDRVERLIREHTGIRYARTISLSYSFDKQDNLFRYKPTAFHLDLADNYRLFDEFMAREDDAIFYIWGHSYEFDIDDTWADFEKFCAHIANREGVEYLTNKEAFFG